MDADTIAEQIGESTPDEWTITTVTDGHIAVTHTSGRSIGMNHHTTGWTVMGVANYGDEDYPRFATAARGEAVVEAAVNAMEAVTNGTPEAVEIVERASDPSDADAPSAGDDTNSDSEEYDMASGTKETGDESDTPKDGSEGDTQPSLTDFV